MEVWASLLRFYLCDPTQISGRKEMDRWIFITHSPLFFTLPCPVHQVFLSLTPPFPPLVTNTRQLSSMFSAAVYFKYPPVCRLLATSSVISLYWA